MAGGVAFHLGLKFKVRFLCSFCHRDLQVYCASELRSYSTPAEAVSSSSVKDSPFIGEADK